MKTLRLLTVTVVTILMLSSAIRGDDATPDIPDSAWELRSEGTDFAAIMTPATTNEPNILLVYLRNNTSSRIQLITFGADHGLQLFFTDGTGARHNLHSYDSTQDISARPRTIIMPGQIRPFKIELTAADLALMKSTPVQCHFYITNLTTKQKYDITTSPKTYSFPQ